MVRIIAVLALVALSMAFAPVPASAADLKDESPKKDESLRMGETRETVDPARYDVPEIRKAYEIAKLIPWVLDSIYCFCYCEENPYFRHKSLLSCYVDDHAAN
jgi:hypothetical protein